MDEEFKIRFSVDLTDAEKKYDKFKKDIEDNNVIEITPELGKMNSQYAKVFANIQNLSKKATKNILWSREKQNDVAGFFSQVESRAYNAFNKIESEYTKLNTELQTALNYKADIELQLKNADALVDSIHEELQTELNRKGIKFGDKNDLNDLYNQYTELQSKYTALYEKGFTVRKTGKPEELRAWSDSIRQVEADMKRVQDNIDNFRIGETITAFDPKDDQLIAELQKRLVEAEKDAKKLDATFEKIRKTDIVGTKQEKLKALRMEYSLLADDLQKNPLTMETGSETFEKMTREIENVNNGLKRSGQTLRANTKLGEFWNRITQRMKFTIYGWLNPLNIARNLWREFQNQNEDVANTFKMISQNLVKVFEPAMRSIANWFLKIMQYVNVFTKAWFGVDLFDKSVLSTDKTKKNLEKINKLTAGFDELHTFEDETSKSLDEQYPTMELPKVDTSSLEKWANNEGKWIGDALNWALQNPLKAAGIALGAYFGTKLLAGLAGKGIGKLIGNLFGGGKTAKEVGKAGSWLGGLFGKELYTGMGGKAVTVGKLLGGVALAAGGTALAIGQAADAGAHWQDLSTGAKAAKVATVGLGSAAAGLGAVMLGASGPVGWAVAGVVALTAFCVGMGQTQDGIDSVKKETEKLATAQANAETANQNYLTSMNNLSITMSNLEQLEQQTGLSGAALAEQVKNGTLTVDKMTSAQLQVYNAYLQNEEMVKQLKEATEAKKEADKEAVLQSLRVEAANAIEAKSYDKLKEKVIQAWKEGSISAEEAGDILSRTLANADDETQRIFGESIPDEMKAAFNPDQYESGWRKFGNNFKNMMNDIGNWFSEKWNGLKNWWNGLWNKSKVPEPQTPSGPNGEQWNGASYAVGTPYVPNDQLAMVHKGEAIIPAKYNNAQTFGGASNSVIQALQSELAAFRQTIAGGIPITGEFVQRGSDLYATVEKQKSKRGTQPLSNASFAR